MHTKSVKTACTIYHSPFSAIVDTFNKFTYIQFAACRADKQDRGNCQYWKNSGFCHRSSKYYAYMQDHCYATCTNCKCK